MTYVPGEWSRCGNTLFFMKMRHHDRVGGTYIDPANLIMVQWLETPGRILVSRKEVPDNIDWGSVELVRFKVSQLPTGLQRRFWTWLNFLDTLKRRGSTPQEVVKAFASGFNAPIRNETLDAFEQGVFASELSWIQETLFAHSREDLDEALSELGVMECPT